MYEFYNYEILCLWWNYLNDIVCVGKFDIVNKCLFFIFCFVVDFVDLEIVFVILRDLWIY